MRLKYLLFVAVSWAFPVYAALDLELTQGVTGAVPIAIASFSGSQVTVPGDESVTQVITNDLQNSGEFRVTSAPSSGSTAVDSAYWRKRGVNDVITGAVTSLGGSRYQVTFSLVDVFSGARNGNAASDVLLNGAFQTNSAGMRRLAHHISDLIYQKLTGIRGIFSTKIAYVLVQRSPSQPDKYTLEVSDADGFNPQALLVVSDEPIMSPAWSPNGQRLAYVSFEGHHPAIYIQNLVTGGRQRVSDVPGINGAPAFSPDGRQLALVLTKTGNPKIYIMNLATGTTREVTFGWAIDTEPVWAADGRSLLFTSNRDGTPQIYSYSFGTGQINRITYNGDYNARPSFTPGGQAIVMMHRQNGLFGIARQDLSNNQLEILTQTGVDESPSLAPNGKMIIYGTEYGGQGVLAQVSIDGRIKLRLPAREGAVQEPAWSPFLNS